MLDIDLVDFDKKEVVGEIVEFIESKYREAGVEKLIVGISGGLDSAVTADLCKRAVGAENVLGLYLPITKKIELPKEFADSLGIQFEELNLSTDYHELFDTLKGDCSHFNGEKIALGNIKARLRMIFLYYHSNSEDGLVVGTGNKSEFHVGYFTKYGDGAADVFPLADLYKSQVREVAKYLGLSQEIIEREPSAGLWEGQTDEDELGIAYEELDPILYGLEMGWGQDKIIEEFGVTESKISQVLDMKKRSSHKRDSPDKINLFN